MTISTQRGLQALPCYAAQMQLADIEAAFPPGEVTFEMSNLSPPRDRSGHRGVRVAADGVSRGVDQGDAAALGLEACRAVYSTAPFFFVAREAWLATQQEDRIRAWVKANLAALLAYLDGEILYDQDVRAVLVPVGDAP